VETGEEQEKLKVLTAEVIFVVVFKSHSCNPKLQSFAFFFEVLKGIRNPRKNALAG
jgi:hypothetical protein